LLLPRQSCSLNHLSPDQDERPLPVEEVRVSCSPRSLRIPNLNRIFEICHLYEFCFAFIPSIKQLMTGCTTHKTRMDQAWKPNSRNMSTARKYSFEIPNCFRCKGIMLVQKSSTIFLMEYSCESPWLARKGLNIEDFDYKDITGVSAFDFNWSGEVMNTTLQVSGIKPLSST